MVFDDVSVTLTVEHINLKNKSVCLPTVVSIWVSFRSDNIMFCIVSS